MSESSEDLPPGKKLPLVTALPPQPEVRRRRDRGATPKVAVVDEEALLPAEREKKAEGKYDPSFDDQARRLCKMGASLEELGEFFEVTKRTIIRWQHAHPSFAEATKTGGAIADERVKRSLYECAIGFHVEEEAIVEGAVVKVKKFIPPDYRAYRMWLMSRQKGEWVDRQAEQPQEHRHLHAHLTPEQARAYVREQQQKLAKPASEGG